jgi:CubicO group peptidase (beta-lactamase class C family)
MSVRLFALLAICTIVSGVVALAAPTAVSQLLEANHVNGIARVWRRFNDAAFEVALGHASIKYRVPLSLEHHFPIASNTKLYIAVALYQLQEDGLVDLESSIANYLNATDFCAFGYPNMTSYCPQVPGNASCQTITFVQLLSMTAGIPANTETMLLPYPGSIAQTFGSSLVAPLLFVPGTQYYYSNPSFNLAGYFVEKLSGMPLPQYLQRRIIEPLGLTSTYLDVYNGQFAMDEKRVDEFYQFIDPSSNATVSTGTCTFDLDSGAGAGAGGLVSSSYDEMVFYFTLFNFSDGAWGMPLLKNRSSLDAIVKPRIAQSDVGPDYYYTQGVGVKLSGPNITSPLEAIVYEGETLCVRTANIYNVSAGLTLPTMAQVWTNVVVSYTSKDAITAIESGDRGYFYSFLEAFPTPTAPFFLAIKLLALVLW